MESEVAEVQPEYGVAAEPQAEEATQPSSKTEYVVLRVVEGDQGLSLVIVNEQGTDGQPVPVGGYSNKQAVKALLTERGWLENELGIGKFIAVPVRSFVVVERRVEQVTTDTLELGSL